MTGTRAVPDIHRRLAEPSHQGEIMQNQMRAVPRTLEELRSEIDRIDDALLDLVEARMAAVRCVADLKVGDGDTWLKLRPIREARVLERMIARAPELDPVLIRQVWTSLMAHGLQIQARMELVLNGSGNRLAMQDAVRARFGYAAALRWVGDEREAIAAAGSGRAVAVITRKIARQDEDAGLIAFETIPVGDEILYAIGRIAPEEAR